MPEIQEQPREAPRYSWRDFVSLEEDDPRELIDGRLVEIDVPTKLHEWIVARLCTYLTTWAMQERAGVVLPSGYKVKVSEQRGVMPDLQFFRRGRWIPDDALEEGAPDLAVEVISPSSGRYDHVEKLNWYAAIGTSEYWIVDGERRTLEQLVLDPGKGYRVAAALGGDAVFEPATFPKLRIPLAELWQLPDWFSEA
ncbi:MAG: Uma2 family endonuclease [Myxococcales bacterium]|nr:Uma2 family endonuclease [Myxococcales bacterium]